MKLEKKQWIRVICCGVAVIVAALFLCGTIGGKPVIYYLKNRGDLGPVTEADIDYLQVKAPDATSKDGTISAADWQAVYPDIVATMGANKENSYVTSYLEQDPYLVNIYEGYGFAKDYGSARGHEYTLEDVAKTERPHALANCLTCKTPNFTKLVNDQGVGVYTMPFDEVMAMMEENISCYTCHGNEAGNGGQIVITHAYVHEALGENVNTIDPKTLNCGQCHIEYYFTPDNKETMMPYHSVEEMTPEAILAYYDEMGFYDWEQPGTGTKMLKAQHPEMETFLQGKHAGLLTCADCHMPLERNEETGVVYHSHTLVSPLENETLMATCATCHGDADMAAMVKSIQTRVTGRETEVGNKLSGLKDALTEAVNSGTKSRKQLEEVRKLHREAQWFFDFCYVENAEGAHNSALAMNCLKTSEEKIDEALALLAVELPATDPAKLMRQKATISQIMPETPAETPAEEPVAEQSETDPAKLMRERPAFTDAAPETPAEPEEAPAEPAETDPAKLMRERPAFTDATPETPTEPEEAPAEPAETDPAKLMRERPAFTDTAPETPTEPEEAPAESAETDPAKLMRERPVFTDAASETPAEPEEAPAELSETDQAKLMRERPAFTDATPEPPAVSKATEPEPETPADEPAEEDGQRMMRTRPTL